MQTQKHNSTCDISYGSVNPLELTEAPRLKDFNCVLCYKKTVMAFRKSPYYIPKSLSFSPPAKEKPQRSDYETLKQYRKNYCRWNSYWKRHDITVIESQCAEHQCSERYGIPPEKKPVRRDYEIETEFNNAYGRWYSYYSRRGREDVLSQAKIISRKVKFIVKPVPALRVDLLPPPPAEWLFPPPPAEWLL